MNLNNDRESTTGNRKEGFKKKSGTESGNALWVVL